MRIGLLVTSIGKFGQQGFYNTQEVGLAKALSVLVDEVKVYKLVSLQQEKSQERISGCTNASILFLPSKSFGNNGIIDLSVLDKTLDALVYFSDTQFAVPKVYQWAKKNNVKFFPYIGVIESHSTNKVKQLFVNWMFNRNLKVYRNSHCLVKTPTVEKQLHSLGVKKITVTPVGLDLSLMHEGLELVDKKQLKEKYGFKESDRVLLFIGRLIDEKQPLKMIDLFIKLKEKDENYKLLLVGDGPLKTEVNERIIRNGLLADIIQIQKIPNNDIWELYRLAECFVNLNQQEIFGMAILEAMYYGCKVVAWRAPGPNLIIENGISGYLVSSEEEMIQMISKKDIDVTVAAHKIIKEKFTWMSTAKRILKNIEE